MHRPSYNALRGMRNCFYYWLIYLEMAIWLRGESNIIGLSSLRSVIITSPSLNINVYVKHIDVSIQGTAPL